MDYFVIDQNPRETAGKRVDFRNPAFWKEEPFVTWMELKDGERLPDLLWGGDCTVRVFCISDRMKDILDSYGCLLAAVPVFLTDKGYRSQQVYWRIVLRQEDCLLQELYAGKEELKFTCQPSEPVHMFKVLNVRAWYPIVSLELAENLLRRHMYGLCFYPVEMC